MTFAWKNDRQLDTITKSNNTLEFKYNSNGMRTQKDDDNYTTYYYYDSNNNLVGLNIAGSTLFFYYDGDGNVTSFKCSNCMYYYIKNLQGDIVKIIDQSGNTKVTYTYDAWGKILNQTDNSIYNLANLNPFRYRGYVYDNETGLYYLQSRYYDPITGRFLNADIYCDTQSNILGTNMFTYCNNNAVNQVDPEGTDAIWLQFPNGANGFGHTSLLIEDANNCWWYFYWGNKHMYLRPCGNDDFSLIAQVNSYLSGFDPRAHHNHFVYAINVFDDKEDTGYKEYQNGKKINDHSLTNHKIHDGIINGSIYFYGDFVASYDYCKNEIEEAAKQEKKSEYEFSVYENNTKISYLHLFNNKNKEGLYQELKAYDGMFYNCVEQSINALLESDRIKNNFSLNSFLHMQYSYFIPNQIYANLAVFSLVDNTYNFIRRFI